VSFLIGQFSLLWIDQQQRLGFDVDVVESDWGHGADLTSLLSATGEQAAAAQVCACLCLGLRLRLRLRSTAILFPFGFVIDHDDDDAVCLRTE
jgi:hypothetical protein